MAIEPNRVPGAEAEPGSKSEPGSMSEPLAPSHQGSFPQRLVATLSAALVLSFASEFLFVNESPSESFVRGNLAENYAVLLAVYGFAAACFLHFLEKYRVRGWPSLLLAGSLYGWVVEGVVVPQAHEAPPLSYLWTAVSWHGLVDVLLVWVLLRRLVHGRAPRRTAVVAAGLGLAWGVWATWLATDSPEKLLEHREFVDLAWVTSIGWILGAYLTERGGTCFRPTWFGRFLLGLGILLGGTGWMLVFLPHSPFLLIPVGLTWLALKLRARRVRPGSILEDFPRDPPPTTHYLPLLLVPFMATLSYAACLDLAFYPEPQLLIQPLLWGGLLAWVRALWLCLRAAA